MNSGWWWRWDGDCLFEVSHESKSRRRAVSHSFPPSQADEPDPASRAHLMEQGVKGV